MTKHAALLLCGVALLYTDTLRGQISVTLTPAKDNTLYIDSTGQLSNGAGSRMFVGNNARAETRRAVLAFDVASQIPACSKILTAQLTLTVMKTTAPPNAVTLHRVLRDWGEGTSIGFGGQGLGGPSTPGDATWIHTFFPAMQWNNAGGDFAMAASASATVAGLSGPVPVTWGTSSQMVADVQRWIDVPAQAFGWLLRGPESGASTSKAFATREDTFGLAPALQVSYMPPAATTTVLGTGCFGLVASASGVPRLGNAGFQLTLSGLPGAGVLAFAFALAPAPAPVPLGRGCALYGDLATHVFAVAAPGGSLSVPLPNNPWLQGRTLVVDGLFVDTSTNLVSTSNALVLKLGV